MNHLGSIFQPSMAKKTHGHIQYPNDFQFHYQKLDNECMDEMSPTSTCPSEGKWSHWDNQSENKTIETRIHELNQTGLEFGNLQGNLLGVCLEKYSNAVSNFIKKCLGYESDKIYEFVLVQEFQGLDLQKQQFSNILTKYNKSGKFINSQNDLFLVQNSTIRSFLEEITYLNYEEINFELMFIISEMYAFKLKEKEQRIGKQEFFDRLAQNEKIEYMSFNFMGEKIENKRRKISFLSFFEKLYQIISQLYKHYKVFQNEDQEYFPNCTKPEMIRNEVKLFSSQRDIWDSDEEDDFVRLSSPNKKIKFFGTN